MNRRQVPAGLFIAACAGLLIVAPACSNSSKDEATSTTSTTPTTTSTTPTTTSAAAPSEAKAAFCREVNTANNIFESPGTNLTETQNADMIAALQSASDNAPADVPADMSNAITAMLADLQSLTENLPPSFSDNGRKLAQYTADYCG